MFEGEKFRIGKRKGKRKKRKRKREEEEEEVEKTKQFLGREQVGREKGEEGKYDLALLVLHFKLLLIAEHLSCRTNCSYELVGWTDR